MLTLKKGHELYWGDLQYIESPLMAKRTIKSNHGTRVGGEPVRNANEHGLPDDRSKVFDSYGAINNKLDNGQVFLINTGTKMPVISYLEITEDNTAKWELNPGQNLMFLNAIDAALHRVQIPRQYGVLRDEPAQPSDNQPATQKTVREKHISLLDLEGQNARPLPAKHNITLVIENTSQGSFPVRQLKEVIYDSFSRVFTAEQGDGFKAYAITDSMLDVKKDLNENKNLAASQANNLITALEETGTETRADGVILHHVKYVVPVPLMLTVGYEYGDKLNRDSVLVLQHEDSEWNQSIHLAAGPKERRVEKTDAGWLQARFEELPESGKFSLILHNTSDGSSDVPFFSEINIEDLPKVFQFEELPLAAPVDVPESNYEWADAAKQQEEWLTEMAK